MIFVLSPQVFVRAYELSGAAGEAAIRGVGVLFLMWNIPYIFATINPSRFRLGLVFALLMQFIGWIGESYIFTTLPAEHSILRNSILRFIAFDGTGLLLLLLAYLIIKNERT